MIDIKLIRESPDIVRAGIAKKHKDVSLVDQVITVDTKRRELRQQTETKQAQQNQKSSEILQVSEEEREALKIELRTLSDQIKSANKRLAELDEQFLTIIRQIPNLPEPEVPEGESDRQNVVIKEVGNLPYFGFKPRDHEQL